MVRRSDCTETVQESFVIAARAARPYRVGIGYGIGIREAAMREHRTIRRRGAWVCSASALGAAIFVTFSVAAMAQASGSDPNEVRNWYNDPFFALSSAVKACVQPLGPRMTKAEADDDAHYRVERGTTCWLAHKCSKPNSYLYDADIAQAIRTRFKGDASLAGTSLWITVQRRFVYAEGCAGAHFDSAALERRLSAIANVEQVFVRVSADPHAPPPYKTMPPSH